MPKLIIETLNPYEYAFPDRLLIDRDTLIMVKTLREQGYKVEIKGQDKYRVEYVFRKGLADLFANPIFVYVSGFVTPVITTLIANHIQKRIDAKKQVTKAEKSITIVNNNHYYNFNGTPILSGNAIDRRKKNNKIKDEFQKIFKTESTDPKRPTPMLYEHQPKIVGWCRVNLVDGDLVVKDGRPINKKISQKIEEGKIKGFSITGIAHKYKCGICGEDYVTCNHITGETYNWKMCAAYIMEATAIEVSLVKEPINGLALLQLIKKS